MRFNAAIAVFLLSIPSNALPAPVVELEGLAPYDEYPDLSAKIDLVWRIVSDQFLPGELKVKTPPPHIAFFPFEKDRQTASWTLFQREWILAHPEIWKDWFTFSGMKNPPEITPEWVHVLSH